MAFSKTKLPMMALTLAFWASASLAGLGAVPAFADALAAPQPVVLTASAVAVADKFSADAAEQIFREGGNAVDAAAAIAFTLAVTYPEAGNLGGGGFMTLYMNGKPYFLDYRERAPLAATKDHVSRRSGQGDRGHEPDRLSRRGRARHGRRHVGGATPLRQSSLGAGAGPGDPLRPRRLRGRRAIAAAPRRRGQEVCRQDQFRREFRRPQAGRHLHPARSRRRAGAHRRGGRRGFL